MTLRSFAVSLLLLVVTSCVSFAKSSNNITRICPEDQGVIDEDSYGVCLVLNVDPIDTEVFQKAATTWTSKILGDLTNIAIPADEALNSCSALPGGGFPDLIDDLFICAQYDDIDGNSGILGQAGPIFFRTENGLPITGEMRFDSADMAFVRDEGLLQNLFEHEMGHIIGIGSIWQSIRTTTRGPLCSYRGDNANREWEALTGCRNARIPTERTGGGGSRCSHWDEDCLGRELMTSGANFGANNVISSLTVAALDDLGYEVPADYSSVADNFTRDDVNPKCLCQTRGRIGGGRGGGGNSDNFDNNLAEPSKEAEQYAIDFGRDILRRRKLALGDRQEDEIADGLVYMGHKFVDILYWDKGRVFGVSVVADED